MSENPVADHFSRQSRFYQKFRPHYPAELFDYILQRCPGRQLMLDIGTGSGQALSPLSEHFDAAVGCDFSWNQLVQREFREAQAVCAKAQALPFASARFDLVTCAQALHWFATPDFFKELQRVLGRKGLFVAWCYLPPSLGAELDEPLEALLLKSVKPYWPPERKYIEQGYHNIEFPSWITPDEHFNFSMSCRWKFSQFMGYLRSWSATQRFVEAKGEENMRLVEQELAHLWGEPERVREVIWPLAFFSGSASL